METASSDTQPRVFGKRWIILFIFCILSASNAFQWMEYAIITNIVEKYYSVSSLAVYWTSMIYMSNYIPLIIPATWLLDTRGLRLCALLGGFGNCMGAWVKCTSARPNRFWLTFIGQTIVGSSQIFTLGLPPRLAAVWFGPKEVSTATALGVLGNQLGIAVGFLVPPMMVENSDDVQVVGAGIERLFFLSAIANSCIFLMIFFYAPPVPPSPAQLAAIEASIDKDYFRSLKRLLFDHNYMLLLVTYGLNVGVFYAVSTLLNKMVLQFHPGEELNVGRIGLVIVFAGMVGSVVCGFWLDRTHTYKWTTFGVYVFSFLGMVTYTLTLRLTIWIIFLVAAFLGFFMTGYLPIGFEFGAELTYPVSEGTVSGLLNASAQFFGVVLTWGMGTFLDHVSVFASNIAMCLILLIGAVVTGVIKNDLKRQRAGHENAHKEEYPLSPTNESTAKLLDGVPSDEEPKTSNHE